MKSQPGLASFIKDGIKARASQSDAALWFEELKTPAGAYNLTCVTDWVMEDLLKSHLDKLGETFFQECLYEEIYMIMKNPEWIDFLSSLAK
jgi:hypothetical protein